MSGDSAYDVGRGEALCSATTSPFRDAAQQLEAGFILVAQSNRWNFLPRIYAVISKGWRTGGRIYSDLK